MPHPLRRVLLALTVLTAFLVACGTSGAGTGTPPSPAHSAAPAATAAPATTAPALPSPAGPVAGDEPVTNIYAHAGKNMLSPATAGARSLVYVPNSDSGSVDVIDPKTFKVVGHFDTGRTPQHVVPSWDLKTLYVTNNASNSLTPIDPKTGRVKGRNIPVADPYNMYFTPDGKHAMVVAEALQRLDFYDPHTWRLQKHLNVHCAGIDHVDFAADNSFFIATCEFASKLVRVNLRTLTVSGYLSVTPGGMPQDIKLDARGEIFYVADMMTNGLYEVDAKTFRIVGFLPTGKGAHGLYPSRDAKSMYVSNRGEGSVSVVDFATRRVVKKWRIPGGGSPDMGGVSADGTVLWLAGRYNAEVYAISTGSGRLLARIKVGQGPHGAAVWPQPGRYSLGHTGILR